MWDAGVPSSVLTAVPNARSWSFSGRPPALHDVCMRDFHMFHMWLMSFLKICLQQLLLTMEKNHTFESLESTSLWLLGLAQTSEVGMELGRILAKETLAFCAPQPHWEP